MWFSFSNCILTDKSINHSFLHFCLCWRIRKTFQEMPQHTFASNVSRYCLQFIKVHYGISLGWCIWSKGGYLLPRLITQRSRWPSFKDCLKILSVCLFAILIFVSVWICCKWQLWLYSFVFIFSWWKQREKRETEMGRENWVNISDNSFIA